MDVRKYIESAEHVIENDTIRIPSNCSSVRGTLAIDWQLTEHGQLAYQNLLTQFAAFILATHPFLTESMVEDCWISTAIDEIKKVRHLTCILRLKVEEK